MQTRNVHPLRAVCCSFPVRPVCCLYLSADACLAQGALNVQSMTCWPGYECRLTKSRSVATFACPTWDRTDSFPRRVKRPTRACCDVPYTASRLSASSCFRLPAVSLEPLSSILKPCSLVRVKSLATRSSTSQTTATMPPRNTGVGPAAPLPTKEYHLDTSVEEYDLNFCFPVPEDGLRAPGVHLEPFIVSLLSLAGISLALHRLILDACSRAYTAAPYGTSSLTSRQKGVPPCSLSCRFRPPTPSPSSSPLSNCVCIPSEARCSSSSAIRRESVGRTSREGAGTRVGSG